jgi:hypothetical protein
MTNEKLKSVFVRYRDVLDLRWPNIKPAQFNIVEMNRLGCNLDDLVVIAHYKFMCDEACRFVDDNCVPKAMRWLGFLQGVLWKDGYFTLDDLKQHSMPDPKEPA